MRAKAVYENLDFERGIDPKHTIGIGGIKAIESYIDRFAQKYSFKKTELIKDGFIKWSKDNGYKIIRLFWEDRNKPILTMDILNYKKGRVEDKEKIFNYVQSGKLEEWFEEELSESVDFQRGRDPKRAMRVGHAEIYPEKVLFQEIHEYCSNNGFPGFQKVTPIKWDLKEPKFTAVLRDDSNNSNSYMIYLTKDEGVVAFYDYFLSDRKHNSKEYFVKDFKHWVRILESNHVQHIEVNESLEFERGKDPKAAMGLGKAANPFVIEFMEEEYDDEGRVTGPLPDDHSQDTWMESCDSQETHYILDNWKDAVDGGYYFYGHMKDADEDHTEMFHAPDFNDEYVEFEGQLYYIPDHKEYWDKIY